MTTPSPAAPHHRFHADALADRPSATGGGRVLGLDGLRAVAVLLVLGFHFGVGGLGGGFFGVDVFYVLSGFLITGLLLAEYERRDRIGLGTFWLRRARRLLPALLLVLVAVTLMVRFAEPAGTYPGFRGAALSALFYVSNWWQVATSGNYFVATGATSPLTHTWSLAVEEQFYLVWPLVVLGVLHLAGSFRRGVRAVLAVAAVGAVASAVEMAALFHPGGNTTRIYFGTDTHAQSVLVGAVLACLLTLVARRQGASGMAPLARAGAVRIVLTVAGLVGGLVVLLAARRLDGASSAAYRGGFLLVALCSAVAIAAVVTVPRGPLARLLSIAPLVWLGTLSYGIYLWHFPVAVYLDAGRTGLHGPALLALRTGVTVAVAAASFYLVERPVLEGRFWRTLRAAGPAVVAVVVTVAVVVAGTAGQATAAPTTPAGLVGATATAAEWRAVHLTSFDGSGRRLRVLIVGDSLALTVAVGIAPYARAYGMDLDGLRRGRRPAAVGPRRGGRSVPQLPDVADLVERRRAPAASAGRRSGHRLLGSDGPRRRRPLAAPRRPGVRRLRDGPARPGGGRPLVRWRPGGPVHRPLLPHRRAAGRQPVAPGRPGPGGPPQPAPGRRGPAPPRRGEPRAAQPVPRPAGALHLDARRSGRPSGGRRPHDPGRGRLPGAPDPAAAGRARPALTDSLVRGREPAGPGCDGRIS